MVQNDDGATVIDREKLIEYMAEKVPIITGNFLTKTVAIYNGQHWDKLKESVALAQLKAEVVQELRDAGELRKAKNGYVNEIVQTLLGIAFKRVDPFEKADPHKVSFKNGTYDIRNDVLTPNSPNDYILHGLDYDIDTSGKDTPVSDYVMDLYFGQSAQFMREFIGYGFYGGYSYHQAIVILKGKPGTGKSNLLMNRLIRPLFAPEHKNISNIKLEQLTGDNRQSSRFNQGKLDGKMLNAGPDLVASQYIQNADQLKGLVSGDPIEAENKGENAFTFTNGAKLLFVANDIPRMKLDNALKERIKVIKVVASPIRGDKKASEERFASAPVTTLKAERGAFAYKLMRQFWQTVGGQLTISDAIKEDTQAWFIDNDPLESFISEHLKPTQDGAGVSVAYLFDRFNDWQEENGFQGKYTITTFRSSLNELGYATRKTTSGTDAPGKNALRVIGFDYQE